MIYSACPFITISTNNSNKIRNLIFSIICEIGLKTQMLTLLSFRMNEESKAEILPEKKDKNDASRSTHINNEATDADQSKEMEIEGIYDQRRENNKDDDEIWVIWFERLYFPPKLFTTFPGCNHKYHSSWFAENERINGNRDFVICPLCRNQVNH